MTYHIQSDLVHVTNADCKIDAQDIADALLVPTTRVYASMANLAGNARYEAYTTDHYAAKHKRLHWRAVRMIQRDLAKGKPAEVRQEIDEWIVELIKCEYPDAPVMVRRPCRGCK